MSTKELKLKNEFKGGKPTSCSLMPFRIVCAGIRPNISYALGEHMHNMLHTIKKILAECRLDYRNDPDFWESVARLLPVVHWEPCHKAPGGITFYLLCKAHPSYDQASFFNEMIARWLIPEKKTTILHTKQLTFRFVDAPDESYLVAETFALVDDERALISLQKNINALSQEIALGTSSHQHARHILVTKSLTQEHKATLIHETIVERARRQFKIFGSDLFFDMHHFLLATDTEFKEIRDVDHMCRVISCHNWFRSLFKKSKPSDRQVLVKAMRTNLHFQFGEKHVLALVIAISFLKEYEQFEARHIASACQRLLKHVSPVSRSFFSYQAPSDSTSCYYLEIEKPDGQSFSTEEVSVIKDTLVSEIPHSIEQLSHTLFIPQNEEEVMRNILLLGQEIRYVRDIPQMIITFQGQSDLSLRFHITLVRLLKSKTALSIEQVMRNSSELISYLSGSRKIIGTVRNKYPKEATTFTLECRKDHFMRPDHSIDLSRAREFIAASIQKAIGDVRDFNGGLMSQQNKLMTTIKELLTPDEQKEIIHLENMFYMMQPVLMRSLLRPELIRELFVHFLKLHHARPENSHPRISESTDLSACTIMVSFEDTTFGEMLHKSVLNLQCKEQELAFTNMTCDGLNFYGYIFLQKDPEKLARFQNIIREACRNYIQNHQETKTLRISLPRPTSSLDPRIGTDRTSGFVIKMLYDGLMRIDRTGKPSFAIAKKVDISDDQKCYTFHLRDAFWTNGDAVLSEDFEYAWKKVLDPNFKAPFAYLFYPIKNARLVKLGKIPIDSLGVRVINDETLEVELEHPAPYFLEHCSHWIYSPLCKKVDQLHPGWAYYGDDTYVSNGPFRLSRWRRNNELQLIKNHSYWDVNAVNLLNIDISIEEDPNNALKLYQQGSLDWIGEPLSEIPPKVFKMRNFEEKISSHPISAVHWYSCNLQVKPLSHPKCRQALAMAIDRTNINDLLFQGLEIPAASILPPSLSQLENPAFDDGAKEKAAILFYEGLKSLGLSKRDLSPFMITCCDQEVHKRIAEHVSRQWKEALGIETKIETYKWSRFMEKCLQHDFQIMGMTWYSWIYDQSYNLEHLHTIGHEMNFAQWKNDTYTNLLDKAQKETDQKERLLLLKDAEKIVMDEIPVIPLFYYTFKYMKKEHLEDIYLSHLGQIDFKWAKIKNSR